MKFYTIKNPQCPMAGPLINNEISFKGKPCAYPIAEATRRAEFFKGDVWPIEKPIENYYTFLN